MIATVLASTVSAATAPKAVNNRPRRPKCKRKAVSFIADPLCNECDPARSHSRLFQAIDRLEAAVVLDDGQEHVLRAAIAGLTVSELDAAEVE